MRAIRLAGAVAGVALLLAIGASAAHAADDAWPDGLHKYRVLLSKQTITIDCQDNACVVRPFTIATRFAGSVAVAKQLPLVKGTASVALSTRTSTGCPGQARVLTMSVTPNSDLQGRVVRPAVNTRTCASAGGTQTFVASPIALRPVRTPVAASGASVLSGLRTINDVTPTQVTTAAGGSVVLVALLAFPSSLLNSGVEAGFSRVRRRRSLGRDLTEDDPEVVDPRWWWAAGGVLGAGVISTFLDPAIGPNLHTVRLLGSFLSSFVIEVIAGWGVVILLMRRLAPTARATYTFRPASLLVVAVLVAISRFTHFQPGLVFGLVAGVTFLAAMDRREQAVQVLVPLAYAFLVALVAWIVYSVLGSQTSGIALFASETLAAAVAGGISALPLVLLPVRGLPGRPVYEWSAKTWAACYVIAQLAFFVILMPFPASWSKVDVSMVAWLGGYAFYLVLGLVAWFALRERAEDAVAPEADPVDAQVH